MANSVEPDCSGFTLFASILNLSLIIDNHLQQTTSADNIFRCILRVKNILYRYLHVYMPPIFEDCKSQ